MALPDQDGPWYYKPLDLDVDVYYLPTGHLCVWCEDVGLGDVGITQWSDEQWVGHIPVDRLDDDHSNWGSRSDA